MGMRMGRSWSVGLLLCVGALGVFVTLGLSSREPRGSSPLNRDAVNPEVEVQTAAAFGCPEGAARVDLVSERFCTVTDAEGVAMRVGPYVRFHASNGQWHAEAGEYWAGRKHGPWTEWYASGARRSKLEFRDGQADGEWLEWYEDGTPKSQGYYADGEEHGLWTFWGSGGELSDRGKMRMGERAADWTGWHANGVERYRRRYQGGIATAWEEWNAQGESTSASDRGSVD